MQLRVRCVDTAPAQSKAKRMATAAVKAYTLAAKRDSEPYVPRLSGDLRSSARTEFGDGKARLTYGGGGVPYARPHYYAPGSWRYTTGGTGPRWFDKAKAKAGARWLREAKQAVKVIR